MRYFLIALFVCLLAACTKPAFAARSATVICNDRHCSDWNAPRQRQATVSRKRHHVARVERRAVVVTQRRPATVVSGHGLVERARAYMGRTGPSLGLPASLWCADFINMLTGGGTGSRLAKSWLDMPRTSARVGAVAVLSRGRRGGHVGVVSGFDARGNPIIVSGNHNRRVGEAVYPKGRVIAYVEPA